MQDFSQIARMQLADSKDFTAFDLCFFLDMDPLEVALPHGKARTGRAQLQPCRFGCNGFRL
jgi:hypothetical protein